MSSEKDDWNTQLVPGLTKHMKKSYANLQMDIRAKHLICNFLNDVTVTVVKKVKEMKNGSMSIENMQKIFAKLIPGKLGELAIVEAQREVFLSETMSFDFFLRGRKYKEEQQVKRMEEFKRKQQDLFNRTVCSGVSEMMKETHPKLRMNKEGNEIMLLYMNTLLDAMAKKLKETKPDNPSHKDVQEVVKKLFPGYLAERARAEGNRMMFKYESKFFEFVPEKSWKSEEKEQWVEGESSLHKESEIRGKEFRMGLLEIVKKIHPRATLHPKVERMICQQLDSLHKLIATKLTKTAQPQTDKEVQSVVQTLLPKLMAEHAAAEGQKLLGRFETGEFDFSSEKYNLQKAKLLKEDEDAIQLRRMQLEPGILAMVKITHKGAILHKHGLLLISVELNNLCDAILKNVKKSISENVTTSDIQKATKAIITSTTLADHAISEGNKMVSSYEMKGFKFIPKKNKRKKKTS